MSEIVVANVFFTSDKQTGIVGGTTNTFSFKVDNTNILTVNSSTFSVNTNTFNVYSGNSVIDIKALIQIYSLAL
jgi:hypothetical protein